MSRTQVLCKFYTFKYYSRKNVGKVAKIKEALPRYPNSYCFQGSQGQGTSPPIPQQLLFPGQPRSRNLSPDTPTVTVSRVAKIKEALPRYPNSYCFQGSQGQGTSPPIPQQLLFPGQPRSRNLSPDTPTVTVSRVAKIKEPLPRYPNSYCFQGSQDQGTSPPIPQQLLFPGQPRSRNLSPDTPTVTVSRVAKIKEPLPRYPNSYCFQGSQDQGTSPPIPQQLLFPGQPRSRNLSPDTPTVTVSRVAKVKEPLPRYPNSYCFQGSQDQGTSPAIPQQLLFPGQPRSRNLSRDTPTVTVSRVAKIKEPLPRYPNSYCFQGSQGQGTSPPIPQQLLFPGQPRSRNLSRDTPTVTVSRVENNYEGHYIRPFHPPPIAGHYMRPFQPPPIAGHYIRPFHPPPIAGRNFQCDGHQARHILPLTQQEVTTLMVLIEAVSLVWTMREITLARRFR